MRRTGIMFFFDGDLDKHISISASLFSESIKVSGSNPTLIVPEIAQTNYDVKRINLELFCEDNCFEFIDSLIALTWFKQNNLIQKLKEKGVKILALGDSDGLIHPGLQPKETLRRMIGCQSGNINKIKAIKHWFFIYLKTFFTGGSIDQFKAIEFCDWFTLPNPSCSANLKSVLSKTFPELMKKVKTLYYPVHPAFFESNLQCKMKQIVTVSRFDDEDEAQKNNLLMTKVLSKFLQKNPDYHWVLIGRKAEERFSGSSSIEQNITCVNYLEKEQISNYLAQSRIMVFTSRWEGSPISANEMLASGGTIVGPNIPGIVGLTKDGRFGSVARRYTSNGLIEALENECRLWESGLRDSHAIREFWKDRTSLQAVGNRIAILFGNNA